MLKILITPFHMTHDPLVERTLIVRIMRVNIEVIYESHATRDFQIFAYCVVSMAMMYKSFADNFILYYSFMINLNNYLLHFFVM